MVISALAKNIVTLKWVKRWWCLYDDKLIYFTDKNDVDPRQSFWIKDISGVRCGKDPRNLEIVIEHSSRVLILRPKNTDEMNTWTEKLTQAVLKMKEVERRKEDIEIRSSMQFKPAMVSVRA